MERKEFFAAWSGLHGDTPVSGIVRGWISISYYLMKPLALLKVSPNALTLAGVVASFITWRNSHSWMGITFLVLSLLCDGLDGTLAILRKSASRWGAVLDSFADRLAELFWALAFYELGAPLLVIAFAWLAAGTQEYVRARMGGLGATKIEVITIAERPVRASILFIALVSTHTSFDLVNREAWMWLIMQLISFVLVFNDGYRRLK